MFPDSSVNEERTAFLDVRHGQRSDVYEEEEEEEEESPRKRRRKWCRCCCVTNLAALVVDALKVAVWWALTGAVVWLASGSDATVQGVLYSALALLMLVQLAVSEAIALWRDTRAFRKTQEASSGRAASVCRLVCRRLRNGKHYRPKKKGGKKCVPDVLVRNVWLVGFIVSVTYFVVEIAYNAHYEPWFHSTLVWPTKIQSIGCFADQVVLEAMKLFFLVTNNPAVIDAFLAMDGLYFTIIGYRQQARAFLSTVYPQMATVCHNSDSDIVFAQDPVAQTSALVFGLVALAGSFSVTSIGRRVFRHALLWFAMFMATLACLLSMRFSNDILFVLLSWMEIGRPATAAEIQEENDRFDPSSSPSYSFLYSTEYYDVGTRATTSLCIACLCALFQALQLFSFSAPVGSAEDSLVLALGPSARSLRVLDADTTSDLLRVLGGGKQAQLTAFLASQNTQRARMPLLLCKGACKRLVTLLGSKMLWFAAAGIALMFAAGAAPVPFSVSFAKDTSAYYFTQNTTKTLWPEFAELNEFERSLVSSSNIKDAFKNTVKSLTDMNGKMAEYVFNQIPGPVGSSLSFGAGEVTGWLEDGEGAAIDVVYDAFVALLQQAANIDIGVLEGYIESTLKTVAQTVGPLFLFLDVLPNLGANIPFLLRCMPALLMVVVVGVVCLRVAVPSLANMLFMSAAGTLLQYILLVAFCGFTARILFVRVFAYRMVFAWDWLWLLLYGLAYSWMTVSVLLLFEPEAEEQPEPIEEEEEVGANPHTPEDNGPLVTGEDGLQYKLKIEWIPVVAPGQPPPPDRPSVHIRGPSLNAL